MGYTIDWAIFMDYRYSHLFVRMKGFQLLGPDSSGNQRCLLNQLPDVSFVPF
jgi:hypothetical protein